MKDEQLILIALRELNNRAGVEGTMLARKNGEIVETSLSSQVDLRMLESLIKTLFTNSSVLESKKNGNVIRMQLETASGLLHFQELRDGMAVVHSNDGCAIDFDEFLRSIESGHSQP